MERVAVKKRQRMKETGVIGSYYLSREIRRVIQRIARDEGKSNSELVEDLLKEALTARIQGLVPNREWEGPTPEDFEGGEP